MQITETQPQTLMLSQNVAQGAHQAVLSKFPDLEAADKPVKTEKSTSSAAHLANSIDILV